MPRSYPCRKNTDNFNPRPPRGGRRQMVRLSMAASDISIHAPREGGDRPAESYIIPDTDISIHAPREGGDSGVLEHG